MFVLKRSIMPPGMAHDVFTPIASVMIGSHFLTYDTMPATELSMRLEKKNKKRPTLNANDGLSHGHFDCGDDKKKVLERTIFYVQLEG